MEKPYQPRNTASIDSQSVDTTSGGELRGRDNAKNVDERKRRIVLDSMGLLPPLLVTAPDLFARIDGQPVGKVARMFADSKHHNFDLDKWVETNMA